MLQRFRNNFDAVLSYVGPKVVAVVVVALMMVADFLAMINMFTQLGGLDTLWLFGKEFKIFSETVIYSFTMVLLLEGNPWFLGKTASALLDKGIYKKNDKTTAILGFWVSLVGLILTWILVIVIRWLTIQKNGGYAAYMTDNYDQFVLHACLSVTPVLTSILAAVASWTASSSNQETKLIREIRRRYNQFLRSQKVFLDILYKNEDAKVALWTSLNVRPNGPMPQDFDSFRQECFTRIRAKLIENCITQYPDQILRFNAAMENMLLDCVEQMSKRSTLPETIKEINLKELIGKYDEERKNENKAANAWNYTIAGRDLEAELKILLDNAVVTAQFKTSNKPNRLEGEWIP